jgi:hypothetical protein
LNWLKLQYEDGLYCTWWLIFYFRETEDLHDRDSVWLGKSAGRNFGKSETSGTGESAAVNKSYSWIEGKINECQKDAWSSDSVLPTAVIMAFFADWNPPLK